MKSLTKRLMAALTIGVSIIGVQSTGHAGHGYDPYFGNSQYGQNPYGVRSYSGSVGEGSPYGVRSFSGGNFYNPVTPVWHDTTHYDYHPGQYVPHGNHAHYVPGHFDLHQSGHWHR